MAASGLYEVVCFGHNHTHEITHAGKTLAVNPGAIMGATFLIYDTATHDVETFEVR